MSDHYRYSHHGRKVSAELNEGHNGSVLNCTHPDCVKVREDAEKRCSVCGKPWGTCTCPGNEAQPADLMAAPAGETHRCSGCGHRWEGSLMGAELCGDCWRKAQPVVHAPAGETARERIAEVIAEMTEALASGALFNSEAFNAKDAILRWRDTLAAIVFGGGILAFAATLGIIEGFVALTDVLITLWRRSREGE